LRRIHRPIPWTGLLIFACLVLPWLVFSWIYFGSPIPITLIAKQHQGVMAISRSFAQGLGPLLQEYASCWQYLAEILLAGVGVAIVARLRVGRLLLIWAASYCVVYIGLGVSSYRWYYAPLGLIFIVLVGLGLTGLIQGCTWARRWILSLHDSLAIRWRCVLGWASLFSRAGPCLLLLGLTTAQIGDLWQVLQHADERFRIYREVGEWLNANTPSDTTVGTLEVGIIGYYARRKMIDFGGLLQTDLSDQFASSSTYEDIAFEAIIRYRLGYLVLSDELFPRFEEEYVWWNCWPVQHFPGRTYHYSRDLSVYVCP
jgi:hypothetical protein